MDLKIKGKVVGLQNTQKYIHYGSAEFKKDLKPITDVFRNKPDGGFWASNVNAVHSWKEFYEDIGMSARDMNKHFTFSLSEDAKIFYIYSLESIPKEYTKTRDEFTEPEQLTILGEQLVLNFDKIMKDYDGIEFFYST